MLQALIVAMLLLFTNLADDGMGFVVTSRVKNGDCDQPGAKCLCSHPLGWKYNIELTRRECNTCGRIETGHIVSSKDVCKERGHVPSPIGVSTSLYCPPKTVDLPDRTIIIYYHCNSTTSLCDRCGEEFSEGGGEPDTVVLWRKQP